MRPARDIRAEEAFDKLFIKKEIPDDIPEFHLTIEGNQIGIIELLSVTNLVPSKSEARRPDTARRSNGKFTKSIECQ